MSKLPIRSQALVFVASTFLISWIEEYFIIRGSSIQNPIRSFCLMWTPGLVGLVCSLVFDRNIKSIALRMPTLKSLGLAYFTPAFVAVLIVSFLVLFSLAKFEISPQLIAKKGGTEAALISALLLAPTIGMILAFVSGLGEEMGWRGFLHTKLLDLHPEHRYLLTGIIWSIWHWPLIIFGDYATSNRPLVNVLFFTIAVVSLSFLMGFLRDRSNSSVPAALTHASHNMWILGIAPVFFNPGPLVPYFGGESGFFCALIYFLIAILIFRKVRKLRTHIT